MTSPPLPYRVEEAFRKAKTSRWCPNPVNSFKEIPMLDDWKDHRGLWAVCEYLEEVKNGGPQEGGWNWTRVEWVRMVALFQTREAAREYTILLYEMEDAGQQPVALSTKKEFQPDYSQCGGDETVSTMHPEGIIPVGWVSDRKITLRVEPQRSEIHYGYWNQLYAPSYE